MVERFGLDEHSFVVELASNDGYLLRNFVARGIPALGIEPAANVAAAADQSGDPRRASRSSAGSWPSNSSREERQADLLIGNNVLAQVPDLNDFVAGMAVLLKPTGVLTMEFPHLLRLMRDNQFDTIYHEHFSYFSFHDGRTDLRGTRSRVVRRRRTADARRFPACLRPSSPRRVKARRATRVSGVAPAGSSSTG